MTRPLCYSVSLPPDIMASFASSSASPATVAKFNEVAALLADVRALLEKKASSSSSSSSSYTQPRAPSGYLALGPAASGYTLHNAITSILDAYPKLSTIVRQQQFDNIDEFLTFVREREEFQAMSRKDYAKLVEVTQQCRRGRC